jgi:hypothetical protein
MAVLFLTVLLLRKVFSVDADETAMIPILVLALGGSTLVHAVFDFNLHILANGLVFVMLLGLLEGWGRQKGVWMPPPFPEGIPKIAGRVGLISAALLIPVAAMLGWGGWAEYQLDVARKQGDAQGVATQAEAMRRWVPLHWRGWTEQGLIYRKEAFWIRDPVERSSRIQQSREAYEQAIRRNPYERIALAGLVELAKMEKDYDSALDGLNELQQLAPFDVRIRIQKGLTLQKLERYEESLAVFEEAQRMRRTQDKQIELNLRYLRRKVRSLEDKRRTDA